MRYPSSMRWLFQVVRAEEAVFGPDSRYRAASLATEGFVHASYRDSVLESARLYFPANVELHVRVIDPRRLDVPVDVADTPRGPMPHIQGAIPRAAVTLLSLDDVTAHDDLVAL